ncbi:MAG: TIGR00730 family Rossman fold protein [Bacteroidales bacterium]
MRRIGSICVFCGSSMGKRPIFARVAEELGCELARRNIGLIYGGSNIGTMRVLADACLENGGKVTGIMPELLASREILHQSLTKVITCDSMAERKSLMGQLSDAFIVLPGGIGTLDELFEALSWLQLGVYSDKPIGLLNVEGYFDALLKFLDRGTEEGFIRPEHRQNLWVDTDPARLIDRFLTEPLLHPHSKWVEELIDDTNHKLATR